MRRTKEKKRSSILQKIWLGATAIGIVTSLTIGLVAYFSANSFMLAEIQERTVVTATIAASKIDADAFDAIRVETGEDDAFWEVHQTLSDFLADETIQYIYTLRLNGDHMEFVVDSDPEDPSPVGEAYDVAQGVIEAYRAGRAIALEEPFVDEWGESYSGFAPIKKANGETVGCVAVDCSTATVQEKLSLLTGKIILAAVICLAFAMAAGWLLARSFKPLIKVAQDAKRVAKGDLEVKFDYGWNDEIGAVCRTIEENDRVMKAYIQDISARLDAISHGDFEKVSSVEYLGDYASIKISLDKLSKALSRVFAKIEDASTAVFSGANGVSSGAASLSESVSRQTELIEEISTKIEALTQKIDLDTEDTNAAMSTAQAAAAAVEEGNHQMNLLQDAMNDISTSSDKIKVIIKTIEDIAFQTNILALNASVEAARAGAAGKGFAVVADEVRNLAGKSAVASEETSKLIENSVQAVSRGMRIAADTSESLTKVVTRTGEIETLIGEIAENSREQRVQVAEINEKVQDVSTYVGTSTSNAEKSAAASEELNGQATLLNQMLDDFRAQN